MHRRFTVWAQGSFRRFFLWHGHLARDACIHACCRYTANSTMDLDLARCRHLSLTRLLYRPLADGRGVPRPTGWKHRATKMLPHPVTQSIMHLKLSASISACTSYTSPTTIGCAQDSTYLCGGGADVGAGSGSDHSAGVGAGGVNRGAAGGGFAAFAAGGGSD